MWDKLAAVDIRYEEVSAMLSSPDIIKDRAQFQKLSKEHKQMSEVVATYRAHKKAKEELVGSRELENGPDAQLAALGREEAKLLESELSGLEDRLKALLMPRDPNDDHNVIMEIRAGTGGDEASLFAGELLRMYTRYAEGRGWKVELMGTSDGTAGGYKEVVLMISGHGAFSRFKFESGVHRVQRVPSTEGAGRIHTSTVTVAVLPEVEEVDVEIFDKDLRIDVFRAGGHGGQSVNTTDSAVRITHIPTGIVVSMQDGKSQIKNRERGMQVLRARIFDKRQQELDDARQAARRGQIGSGERSEKIRTYNFPQSRLTDHRIGLSLYSLTTVINGDLDQVVEPLITHHRAELLKGESSNQSPEKSDDDLT